MANDDADTEEPHSNVLPASVPTGTPKKAFGFLELDGYRDLKSPLVGKFLKDHIERLEDEIAEIKPYREKYYDVKSKLEILEERKGFTRVAAGVSSVMLAVGGVGIGAAKDLWTVGPSGFIIGIASIALIVSSFLIRVRS